MLKGCIKCSDVGKFILDYINFDLSKGDIKKMRVHLRNCPVCKKKFLDVMNRKAIMKKRRIEIEKMLRMQFEISGYIDNETSEDYNFIIEAMLYSDKSYKKELKECEELRKILNNAKSILIKKHKPSNCISKINKPSVLENIFKVFVL